ncbi:nitrogen regulation protein NR(II) [Thiobacillus sp.]|uniref:nitrogen regulation protein NR(II) n=1 Tax=Thiobacillus sp. TaxID=924 RepID=UPI0011DB7E04|nr:nitrogen regulation protein NR(II) [Thiobacillus sp.]MBC2738964.1 PAS domain-containing protein [Thiobacillus sp.]MBC2760748.1 PAS domain-containing protein [Thiobacillus sp.]MBD3811948.1 PAS domain-containing protein [Betaproteobacteria bacterium]TXH73396.1 MAG: PAS domain-containing protein [Thiobacillus sp.]
MSMPPFSPTDYSGLDYLSTGTMILDAGRRIIYVNPAAETLLGISGVLLLEDDAMTVFERSPELLAAVQTACAQQETVIEYELDVVVSGHPPIRLSCSVSPLDKPEDAVLIEMRAVDPHLRIARLEQARLQQEANRELLRNLAHEIKNPLGGIRGAAQLLEHELPRESLREYTQVIIKESDRLQSLMERLLTPHRMPRFGAVNIHEVLERVRSLILAETPSMSLRRDYDISLPEIRADAEQLIQATLNIARNAVQAMHGQGEIIFKTRVARQITLESRRYQLGMRVEIIDNGPGIPDEIREQIFFPLVSGREGGSGLGLAVAQTLVAQNHGTIDCESRPGRTSFSIFLPLPG